MERSLCLLIAVVTVVASAACSGDDKKPLPGASDAGTAKDAQGVPRPPDHGPALTDVGAPRCSQPADCRSPATDPPECAVADCSDGQCVYHTRDVDGDGYYADDGCRITDGSVQLISGDDCADDDPDVHPGAWDGPAGIGPDGKDEPDHCDLKDENCDGLGDNQKIGEVSCKCGDEEYQSCWAYNNGTPIPYPLNQLKETGTCRRGFQICNAGHWSACFNARPPEQETCDGLDNDCNGIVDDNAVDAQPYYCDRDKDDHIAIGAKPVITCPKNLMDCPGGIWRTFESSENLLDDCDDGNSNRYPGNIEICDGVDNDCDPEHLVDEIREDDGGIIDKKKTYYRDHDGDGFGDPNKTKHVCPQELDGYVETPGDCDDTKKAVHPTALETCNGVDDDCDGQIDNPPLSDLPQMPGTTFACVDGQCKIVTCPQSMLDCDGDCSNGCETDGTTLANCHGCNTACAFSCGATGCDEIESISAGGSHTCALTTGHVATCWGSNEKGQLGDEHVANASPVPIRVSGLPEPVYSISARIADSCAIAGPDRALYCWGDNRSQQCGASAVTSKRDVLSPEAVDAVEGLAGLPLTNVTKIDLSGQHACAVHHSGHIACWGDNTFGQVGPANMIGGSIGRPTSVHRADQSAGGAEVTDASSVATGADHTCLVNQSGRVECWGYNADGECGTDPATDQVEWPKVVEGVDHVLELRAGDFFTCALVESGDVYCWGDNISNQLGNSGGPSEVPVKVSGLGTVQHIIVGGAFACATTLTGTLTCWGDDSSAQCGVPAPPTELPPVAIDLEGVSAAGAGSAHVCAVDASKRAYCWGSNESGKLGFGAIDKVLHPKPTSILPLR